ncbi:MAG: HAD family hydrolase [Candidatus Cyclobacteriaceae bacterium M3_2C_046]
MKRFAGVILDLDGVITRTVAQHAKAWKMTFDAYLEADQEDLDFGRFDLEADFENHIDGKARVDAARDFLNSRNLYLPEGDPADQPDKETLYGLSNKKNQVFLQLIEREGVKIFQDTLLQLTKWKERGFSIAVISSSKNGKAILKHTGLDFTFDVVVDGFAMKNKQLAAKPSYEAYLFAAQKMGLTPSEVIVIENSLSGVKAGKTGDFGLVVGVTRNGNKRALIEHGADVVVDDLQDLKSIGMKKVLNYEF